MSIGGRRYDPQRMTSNPPHFLQPGEGRALDLPGRSVQIKAAAEHTAGALAVAECALTGGIPVPPHVHAEEDIAVYVLDGELSARCGHVQWKTRAGGFVLLPRGVPHSVSVLSRHARTLVLAWPAGVEELLRETQSLIDEHQPAAREFAPVAAKYGIRMVSQ
jgi:quercetin dioxygenase-like cupin family protein